MIGGMFGGPQTDGLSHSQTNARNESAKAMQMPALPRIASVERWLSDRTGEVSAVNARTHSLGSQLANSDALRTDRSNQLFGLSHRMRHLEVHVCNDDMRHARKTLSIGAAPASTEALPPAAPPVCSCSGIGTEPPRSSAQRRAQRTPAPSRPTSVTLSATRKDVADAEFFSKAAEG